MADRGLTDIRSQKRPHLLVLVQGSSSSNQIESMEKKQVQLAASKEKNMCEKLISAITISPAFSKKIRQVPPLHGDDSGRASSIHSSSSLQRNKLSAPSGTVSTGFSNRIPKSQSPTPKKKGESSPSLSGEVEIPIIFVTSTPPPPPGKNMIRDHPMNQHTATADRQTTHAYSPASLPTYAPAGPTVSQHGPQKSSPTSAKVFMGSAKAQENMGRKQVGSPQLLQGKGEDKASRRPIAAAAKNDHEDMLEYTEGGSRNDSETSSVAFDRVMNSSLLRNDSFNHKVTAFIIETKNKFYNMPPNDEN